MDRRIKQLKKNGEPWKEEHAMVEAAKRDKIVDTLTKDELFLYEVGRSNRGFHYHGSAKFFARIGQAFADALVGLEKDG